MGKKVGPNFSDEKAIREWYDAGKTAGFISDALNIEEAAIQRFINAHIEDAPVEDDYDDEDDD